VVHRPQLSDVVALLAVLTACGGLFGAETSAELREIPVHVVHEDGRPVADARVGVLTDDQRAFEVRTVADGRSVLQVPRDAPLQTVWAMKPGMGVDYHHFREGNGEAHGADTWLPQDFEGPVKFHLSGVREATVKVVDEDTNEPLAESVVVPWYLYKPGKGGEFNISGLAEFARTTDERGIAVFDVLPADNGATIPLLIRSAHHVVHRIYAIDPHAAADEVVAELVRKVRVSGRVFAADGSPTAGASVLAAGDGYHYGYFRTAAKTGDDGKFELEVSPDEYYSLVAERDDAVSQVLNIVVRKGEPTTGLELSLARGTRLHGQVTLAPDNVPVANFELKLRQRPAVEYRELGAEQQLPNPSESRDYIQPLLERATRTDEAGRFEFVVGPGSYYLVGPFSAAVPRFTITDEPEYEVNLVARDGGEFTEP